MLSICFKYGFNNAYRPKGNPSLVVGDSPLKSLIKVSTLEHNHPVKKFLENRQIPSHSHHELFLDAAAFDVFSGRVFRVHG